MLRLLILRHAKAVPHGAAPDLDRALMPRGRAAASEMGRYLSDEMLLPDLVLVSPSQRTRETWSLVQKGLAGTGPAGASNDVQVEYAPSIYQAEERDLLDLVRTTPDTVRTLLLIGHNPSIAEFARALVGHGDRYAASRMRSSFPTAALAVLDFDVEHWAEVAPRGARLDRFRVPDADPAASDTPS